MGDILSSGLASVGATWSTSPVITELERRTIDWLVEILGLPENYKNTHDGPGCGIIQTTASESTMIAIMTARARAVEAVKMNMNSYSNGVKLNGSSNGTENGIKINRKANGALNGTYSNNGFSNGISTTENCTNGTNGTNGYTNGTNGTNGYTNGTNTTHGHTNGTNTTNGHTNGTNTTNGHINGTNTTNGQTNGKKNGFVNGYKTNVVSNPCPMEIDEDDEEVIEPYYHDPAIFQKLIAYCSDQAHSSVEKGAMVNGVKIRKLKSTTDKENGNLTVTKEVLEAAIKKDRARGLIPFIYVASLGTTNTCGFDRLDQLGPICERENIWLHVDAAYAGSLLVCPEFRYLINGAEYCNSFNFNAHKGLMISYDCSIMWFKDGKRAANYFKVEPLYLKHENEAKTLEYRHLQIALGRRFRSLKLWFVLRNFGVPRLQETLRTQVKQAEHFAELMRNDPEQLFEFFVPQHLGLVCFKIRNGTNEENEALWNAVNADRRIHITAAIAHDVYFLRLMIASQNTTFEDVDFAMNVIKDVYHTLKSQ